LPSRSDGFVLLVTHPAAPVVCCLMLRSTIRQFCVTAFIFPATADSSDGKAGPNQSREAPTPSNASLYLIRKSPGLMNSVSSLRSHLLQESSLEFHCLAALHLTFGQNPRIHWNILPSQKAGTVTIGEMYAIRKGK
jgi:hypothetical protein